MTAASTADALVTFDQEPGHAELGCELMDVLWKQDRARIAELSAEVEANREEIFTLGGRAMRAEGTVGALEGEVEVLTEALTQTQEELDTYTPHHASMKFLGGLVEGALREAYRVGSQRTHGPVPSTWAAYLVSDEAERIRAKVRERVHAAVHQVLVDELASMYSAYQAHTKRGLRGEGRE